MSASVFCHHFYNKKRRGQPGFFSFCNEAAIKTSDDNFSVGFSHQPIQWKGQTLSLEYIHNKIIWWLCHVADFLILQYCKASPCSWVNVTQKKVFKKIDIFVHWHCCDLSCPLWSNLDRQPRWSDYSKVDIVIEWVAKRRPCFLQILHIHPIFDDRN